jgi:hypothetical protein
MADRYAPEDNNNLATYPGPSIVKLDANVNAELGKMTVSVSGYGQVPAAANAMTGQMRGINVDAVDNTGGAQGAKSVTCRPGVFRFKNDANNPCTQATVGATVYASDGETISTASADGPPAGMLLEFNAADALGRPCKVALKCFK